MPLQTVEPQRLYRQIAEQLRSLIADGEFAGGSRLPAERDLAKRLVKMIKDSKMKVQASIQGDTVRVTGAKRDDLQAAIALMKKDVTDVPLGFQNFRD